MSEKEQDKVKEFFESAVGQSGGHLTMKALSPDDHPVLITKPEFMRRMKEMQSMQGMDMGMMPDSHNVVVNTNHPLIAEKLLKMKGAERKEGFASYLYDLARLNQNMLKGEDMSKFIEKSLSFVG